MKALLVSVLLTIPAISLAAISLGSVAHAEAIAPKPAPAPKNQSAPLVTRPASVDRLPSSSSSRRAPYTAEQLNGLLGTLEAKPQATPQPKSSIESLIQRFSTSDRKPAAIDPIDFFKPPALDSGVKIPLQ